MQFNQSYTLPYHCEVLVDTTTWLPLWLKEVNGSYKSITLSKAARVHTREPEPYRMDLVFTVVLKEDEGLYKCQLFSEAGPGPSRTIKLIVEGLVVN